MTVKKVQAHESCREYLTTKVRLSTSIIDNRTLLPLGQTTRIQTDRDTLKITFMEGNNVAETKTSSLKAANGIFLSLLSAITASFSAEFVALASKDGLPRFQVLFLMRLIELLGVTCVAAFCRPRFMGENRHQNTMLVLFVIFSNVVGIAQFLSFTYTVPGIANGIIQGSMPFF
ncbi:hypothetical protein Bbelb_193530, partial [Branchiostoma belcheri]